MTTSKISIKKYMSTTDRSLLHGRLRPNTAHPNVIAEPIKANEEKNEYSELRLTSKRRKSKGRATTRLYT